MRITAIGLSVHLPHVGNERRKRIDLRADHAARVRLEVKPFWLGPTVHGPIVGHAKQDPPAERVSE